MVFCDGECLRGTLGINAGGLTMQVGGKRFLAGPTGLRGIWYFWEVR